MCASIYHEKQVKELCALHALNNLFQRKEFSKIDLDEICENLAPDKWVNPHKSLLGLGNYDINVILTALQFKQMEGVWFDKRKDPKNLILTEIFGFILNIPNDYKFGIITLPLHRRHWIAIKKINQQYFNLDSKSDKPQLLGDDDQVVEFFANELKSNDKELFVVVKQEIEKQQSWINQEKEA